MPEWKVTAILNRSAGNAEVGEMWQETAVFSCDTKLLDVLKWAVERQGRELPENFRGHLQLAIAQEA